MPARCIHSRSFRIPSLVIFPFIQCHHTRGFAAFGGFLNLSYNESSACFSLFRQLSKKSSVDLFLPSISIAELDTVFLFSSVVFVINPVTCCAKAAKVKKRKDVKRI